MSVVEANLFHLSVHSNLNHKPVCVVEANLFHQSEHSNHNHKPVCVVEANLFHQSEHSNLNNGPGEGWHVLRMARASPPPHDKENRHGHGQAYNDLIVECHFCSFC